MNFYKHHLGDYDGATAHLTWDEDCAYTRLLRAYYRREKQIPPEIKDACRLVRANSAIHKRAVETVLNEFFDPREDGWHNKRADEEIAAYQAQSSTNKRIARERWGNEPSTNRTQSVHEPSTDTELERTPNQNQNQNQSKPKAEARAARGARLPTDWKLPKAWGDWALTEQPTWDAEYTRKISEMFRDYWKEIPGQKGLKLTWEGTWHNWVKKEGPRATGAGKAPANGIPQGMIKCRNPACGKIVATHTDRLCDTCYETRDKWQKPPA